MSDRTEEEARQLLELQYNPGWKLVDKFMHSRMEDAKHRLLTAKTMEEVVKYQAMHEAHKAVYGYVKDSIEKGIEEE